MSEVKKTSGASLGPDAKVLMAARFERHREEDAYMLDYVTELKGHLKAYMDDKEAIATEVRGLSNDGKPGVLKEYPAPIVGSVVGLLLAGLAAAGINTEMIDADQLGQVVTLLLAGGLPTAGGLAIRAINKT